MLSDVIQWGVNCPGNLKCQVTEVSCMSVERFLLEVYIFPPPTPILNTNTDNLAIS